MLYRSVSLPTTSSWPPPPRGSRPPSWRDSPGERATSQGPQPLLTIQLENLTSERFAILAIIGFFQRGSAKAAESATAVNFPFPAEKKQVIFQVPRLLQHLNWPTQAWRNRKVEIKSVFTGRHFFLQQVWKQKGVKSYRLKEVLCAQKRV